jgi:hypothetical protein
VKPNSTGILVVFCVLDPPYLPLLRGWAGTVQGRGDKSAFLRDKKVGTLEHGTLLEYPRPPTAHPPTRQPAVTPAMTPTCDTYCDTCRVPSCARRLWTRNTTEIRLNLPTHLPTYPLTHQPTNPPTHLPAYPPTHQPTYPPTHLPPTHLSPYPPTHLPTYPAAQGGRGPLRAAHAGR